MSLSAENKMQIDVNNSGIKNAFAVQGDHVGRKIRITLLSQGEVVDLTGCTATVKCSVNNSTIAVNSCAISANDVIVTLTKTMLAHSGKVKLQVSIADNSGAVLSSPIIYLLVSESISTSPVEDVPDFSILADLTGRIMAVLNDPAAGESEIKDARGGHTLLGDRLNSIDRCATFPSQTYNLIPNHVNFSNASGWNTVNSGTLTASGALLTAVSESNLRIYADLEKSVPLNANASVLVKIRARCTSGGTATLKPCWRTGSSGVVIDKSYIIAGNVKTADITWSVGSTFADLWLIAKDGTAQATIDRVGLQISSGATVEIGHFEVFYSQDEGLTNGELEDLQADVNQSRVDIGNLQTDVNGTKDSTGLKTRMSAAESNITALQGVVNGSADVSGTVKNQIAAAKTDVINNSVTPLAERVKATENHVSTLQTEVSTLNTYATQIGKITDVTGGLIAGFVNANTGILGTGGNYQRTDYIPVSSNAVVYYSGRIFGWAGVAGFDKNKKYVTAILKNDDGVGRTYDKHILNIPDNVKYIIATTMAKSFGLEIITHKKIVDFKIEPDSNIIPSLNHFAVFKSFSAIGDSITEGLYPSTFNEDGSVKKWAANKSFSWVRYLGALTGASNYNYGVSGATAKTWYTNQYGYSMMVNNNKRTQAYIIGLGVNDVISADYPIGSVADVDFDDCSNNAETFIGCYAKIIQSVISLNPTAKIFCLIPPNISASTAPKYDALKTLIADEHFGGTVFCVDLSSQDYAGYYQTKAVTKFKFGVHYSAPGYAQLAKILLYALSKTMIDNSQYFNQISEIVYDA